MSFVALNITTLLHTIKELNGTHTKQNRFDKLITALRTVMDNDGVLDKESTSYKDITFKCVGLTHSLHILTSH
jgi:hypothetical protein